MKTLMTFVAVLATYFSAAQTIPPHEFLDKNYKVTTQSNSTYYVILEQDKRIARNNKIAFDKDGNKRLYQEFSNYAAGIRHGLTEEYYADGKLLSRTNYVKDKAEGTARRFWPDGTTKRETVYLNGVVTSEKCFDTSGKEVAVYPLSVRAQFPDGVPGFYKYIIKNVSTRNMTPNSTGRLLASFTIGTDGKLNDIKIIRGINNLVDAAFIDVLKKSPKWTPAMEENVAVESKIVIPINLVEGANNEDFFTAFQ